MRLHHADVPLHFLSEERSRASSTILPLLSRAPILKIDGPASCQELLRNGILPFNVRGLDRRRHVFFLSFG